MSPPPSSKRGGGDHHRYYPMLNLLAYVVNAATTYAVGTGQVEGYPSNADLSRKYQTLVTPAGWAFSIWGCIFCSQLYWILYQQRAGPDCYADRVATVKFDYVFVCLFQVGWTFAFSRENIELSLLAMALILLFLAKIVFLDLRGSGGGGGGDLPITDYLLWKFPLSIHFAWILAATALNANVLLVANESPASTQFAAGMASIAALLAFNALLLLRSDRPDFTVGIVACWTFLGIYYELKSLQPTEKQEGEGESEEGGEGAAVGSGDSSIADRFTETQIEQMKSLLMRGAGLVAALVVAKARLVLKLPQPTATTAQQQASKKK